MSAAVGAAKVPPSLLPPAQPAIVPARLGFLAIYNPSFGGRGEDSLEDQIVYYSSITSGSARRRRRRKELIKLGSNDGGTSGSASSGSRTEDRLGEEQEKNERLRQIGFAQGMVEFAKGFSEGEAVDTAETEKTRVVVHELEHGWWVVASIDLTRLPPPPSKGGNKTSAAGAQGKSDVEYSSREVKPAALLLTDLQRAHQVFLMHHAPSLSALWDSLDEDSTKPPFSPPSPIARRDIISARRRRKFMSSLEKYWDRFLATWSVMLHGNPVRDVFGGIRVAACGELGVGVGEEERGSGERDVLEGFTGRVEGLVDLVVGRFGDGEPEPLDGNSRAKDDDDDPEDDGDGPWLGTGDDPSPEDGAIFLGVGALSRTSLKDVVCWMEDLYTWGEHAYGVSESLTDIKKSRKGSAGKRLERQESSSVPAPKSPIQGQDANMLEIKAPATQAPPAPIVAAATTVDHSAPDEATTATNTQHPKTAPAAGSALTESLKVDGESDLEDGSANKFVSYLKFGYGTYWSLPGSGTGTPNPETSPSPKPETRKTETSGHYLVGLVGGDMDTNPSAPKDEDDEISSSNTTRILLRTLTLELDPSHVQQHDLFHLGSGNEDQKFAHSSRFPNHATLRVVVYVAKPFIYVLLFRLSADNLMWGSLYHSLHTQFQSLRKSLVLSTNYRPERPIQGTGSKRGRIPRIYDLVYDVERMTVHCTIPSIPEPGSTHHLRHGQNSLGKSAGGGGWFGGEEGEDETTWSRVEALNTHTQLLNIWSSTRRSPGELERTAKTSRGWWVVWSRIMERQTPSPKRNPSVIAPALLTHAEVDENDVDSSSSDVSARPDSAGAEIMDEDEERDSIWKVQIQPRLAGTVRKEIFLIRRAGEISSTGRSDSPLGRNGGSGRFGGAWEWGDGASRLAQGIGVDTKKYIEGLLSLNR